jgi:hypothetical protein
MIKNNGINAQCGSFCIENLKLIWREARQIVVQLVLETWERRKSAKYNIFSLLSSLQPAMTNIRKKLKSVHTYICMLRLIFDVLYCTILGRYTVCEIMTEKDTAASNFQHRCTHDSVRIHKLLFSIL